MTRARFTVRRPVDLIALAPHLLGFQPRDSVVLMTFGEPGCAFHARTDLPAELAAQRQVAETLLAAVERNPARTAAVLVFSTDDQASRSQAGMVVAGLVDAGVRVLDALRVEDDRYFDALVEDDRGTAYDVSAHPFTAQMVFEGRVVQPSREALADSLVGGDQERVEAVAAAAALLAGARDRLGEARWLQGVLDEAATSPEAVSDRDVARILVDCGDTVLRDLALARCTRATAEDQVRLWRHLVRLAPRDLLAPAAAVLAFVSWLAGDGALSWCAVDRCLEADPDHSLAHLVAELLENAVPPTSWGSMERAG